jgi:virginiamycin B lyase
MPWTTRLNSQCARQEATRSALFKGLATLLFLSCIAVNASGLVTIDEFALPYPEPPPCPKQTPGTHPESTHEITYDSSAPTHLWVTGQNDDAVVRVGTDGSVEIYALPPCSGPHGIIFDSEGRLWVSLEFAGKVVQLQEQEDRLVEVKAYDVRLDCDACAEPLNTHPHGLAVDPDGETLWFTGKATGTVGKITPEGTVETFALSTVGSVPIYIRAGPDGNMWFTELVGNAVGRITPAGVVTEFPIPTPNSRPIEIVPDPDGQAMWFTEEAGNKVGRIAMDGTISEYPVPKMHDNVILAGLAFDPDGNLWVQQYTDVAHLHAALGRDEAGVDPGNDYLVRIDRSSLTSGATVGAFTFYEVPTRETVMHRIILGPDDNLWFTELRADKVGRLSLGTAMKED